MEQQHTVETRIEQLPVFVQVWEFFRYKATEGARLTIALGMAAWSLVLFVPGNTLGSSPNLSRLTWATDEVWGSALGAIALLTYLSARYQWRKVHAGMLLLTCGWWIYLTVQIVITCLVRSVPLSSGIAAYGTFSFVAIWAFWRYMARNDVIRRRGGE